MLNLVVSEVIAGH